LPDAQFSHAVEFAGENEPAGQSVHAGDCAAECFPAGHAVQIPDNANAYFPDAQFSHAVEFAGENEPAGQSLHAGDCAAECFPAGHAVQTPGGPGIVLSLITSVVPTGKSRLKFVSIDGEYSAFVCTGHKIRRMPPPPCRNILPQIVNCFPLLPSIYRPAPVTQFSLQKCSSVILESKFG
jgi:hypothetical protein